MRPRQAGHWKTSARFRRNLPRSTFGIQWLISVLATATLLTLLPIAQAQAAPPSPSVPLPPELDIVDEYQGQSLCDPTPKEGTARLRETLWNTYGRSIWASISRDCNVSWDPGISEHKDGRAIDWGVTVRNGTRAYGDEFLAWATANNGENARRMGIMYIIWDSRMWRLYDMGRGFPEYRTCLSALTSSSYDTTCHRDHMHISMTWHGGGAWTSWYDGTAVTDPECRAGEPVAATQGSPASPSVVLDPLSGIGVPGGEPCYLGNSIQTLKFQGVGNPGSLMQLRVSQFRLNSPSKLKMWTNAGASVTLDRSTSPVVETSLAVAADGLVYFQVPVGQASVRVEGLGGTTTEEFQAFVKQVYRDVLGREAEADGLAYWTMQLSSGALGRGGVMRDVVFSPEGAGRAATAMYREVLGREPERAGLDWWVSWISGRGVGLKDARARFWASSERVARSGSVERWVDDLYTVELGRPAEPGGLAYWSRMVSAEGYLAVARGVLGSQEWSQRQVTVQYRSLLARDPEPAGLSYWTALLIRADLADIQIGIGGSPEYFNRANR